MSDKLSQKVRVLKELKSQGMCSRNYFLDLPFDKITRLSHIIMLLRREGYDIKTDTDTDPRDTIYRLSPLRVEHYWVGEGESRELMTKNVWK